MILNRRYRGKIEKIPLPAQRGTLTYNGKAQSPVWNNYDAAKLTIGGTTSSVNAGTFTATFTPKRGYCWQDGSRNAKSVSWSIQKPLQPIVVSKYLLTVSSSYPTNTMSIDITNCDKEVEIKTYESFKAPSGLTGWSYISNTSWGNIATISFKEVNKIVTVTLERLTGVSMPSAARYNTSFYIICAESEKYGAQRIAVNITISK